MCVLIVGRPPKISLNLKIEETVVTEEIETTDTIKSIEVTETIKSIEVTETPKSIKESVVIENIEETEQIEVKEKVKSIKELDEILASKTMGCSSTDSIFIVPPAPSLKTLYVPIINLPYNLKKILAYDFARNKYFKHVCMN